MATFVFYDEFKRYLGGGATPNMDLTADTFIEFLSNTAPVVATHISEGTDQPSVTEANGYTRTTLTAGWTETAGGSGIWRFDQGADVSWTASGGSFGPFQYVNIYDDTITSPVDLLMGYWDVGTATTITNGNTFTVDVDANFEVFTLDG